MAYNILSLGAGVQSSTVLLMSLKGDLPKLDAAIFADTQWEHPDLYEHLTWLSKEAAVGGIPVCRVTAGNLRKQMMESFTEGTESKQRYATIPMHILAPDGKRGLLRRQCTQEYKIGPIERYIRRNILGLRKGQRAPHDAVNLWFGISSDETRRIRTSGTRWKTHTYPLCNIPNTMLDRPHTRAMCIDWLGLHFPERTIPRSSCIGCPFHSNAEWRHIKKSPVAWADVVAVDKQIRNAKDMHGTVYLHRQCKPLDEVDLRDDTEKGQSTFGWDDECLGYCGN